MYLFLYVPLLVTIVFSFNDSAFAETWNGFTVKWYASLFNDKSLIHAALRSLFLAACVATFSTVVGTIMAIALHRYRFIGQKVVYGSLSVIMLSPEIIQGISLVMIFVILGIPLGFTTLLLSHSVFCFPFVTMTVLARLKGVKRDLSEAAADLGANDVDIFRFILIPLILPALFAGWLMSFTLSLDDVIISFFVLAGCVYIIHWNAELCSLLFFGIALMLGVGFGIMFPAYNTLFVNLAPNKQRGTATSTYLTSWDVGIGIGMLTGGYIAEISSFDKAYLFGACLTIVSTFYFHLKVSPHYHKYKIR